MRNSKINDWEKLVVAARENDQKAIEEIYELTYAQGFSVAMQMLKNEEDVLDVLQDSYVSAFKNINGLKDANKFKSWFNCIVANRCRDYLRKNKAINFSDIEIEEDIDFEDTLESDIIEFSPEEAVDYEETKRIVNEILQSLPAEQKLCILMYYYNELSVKEISEALGCSENTIKTRLSRGRNQIKNQVKELEKKGTKLYNFAPITLLIWLLHSEEERISETASVALEKKVVKTVVNSKSKLLFGSVVRNMIKSGIKGTIFGSTKLLIAGAAIVGVAAVGSVVGLTMHQSSIEQKVTEITLEAGDPLEVSVEDFFDTPKSNYKNVKLDTSAVDTLNVGEYDIKASYRDNDYVIKVKVQDTTAPEITLKARHVYMSDLTKPVEIEYEYYDATKVTMSLVGAEKIQEMKDITEDKVRILTEIIKLPCDQEKLGKITTITDEEGILRGVLKFEDAYGNFYLEEIVIVYDKPDGEKPSEETTEESDEKTDEKEDGKTDDKKPSSNQSTNKPSGNSGNTGTASGNNNSGSGNSGSTGNSTPSAPSKPSETQKPSEPEIEPPDTSMTPAQQAAVNAGYYKVVPMNDGGYVVMVKGPGEFKYGLQLIEDYLNSIGMESTGGSGGLIGDEANNRYMCSVSPNQIREKT